MSDLPSHVSPYFSPQPLHPEHAITDYSLSSHAPIPSPSSTLRDQFTAGGSDGEARPNRSNSARYFATTPTLSNSIPPAFTLPSKPSSLLSRPSNLIGSGSRVNYSKPPKLLRRLPHVECIVRARIPTTTGAEMFLHLYQNDVDNKEHLAIVFGNIIRSRSLDHVREGETEMDRMIRGAYVGRLRPGRVSSRYDKDEDDGTDESKIKRSVDGVAGSGGGNGAVQDKPVAQGSQIQAPLVRIHSECYTGETAWSARCDCGEQLDEAARLMSEPFLSSHTYTSSSSGPEPSTGGVIVYLRQEGRGIGLGEKLKAYNLQDLGSDTVEANLLLRHPADARSYGIATAILVDLGLGMDSANGGIRLLTNNPDKVRAVEGPNREVVVKERVPMIPLAWRTGGKQGITSREVEGYLRTKIAKMGHMIE